MTAEAIWLMIGMKVSISNGRLLRSTTRHNGVGVLLAMDARMGAVQTE